MTKTCYKETMTYEQNPN